MNDETQVAVIGGGAAGLAAAISAAREGAHVVVLEADERVGQKILKTGNGRCNLSNAHVTPADYNDPGFVAPIVDEYPARRVLDFFETVGLLATEDGEGRIYPLSNAANSVLDVLRAECSRLGVGMLCGRRALSMTPKDAKARAGGFEIGCAGGNVLEASRAIVATGGASELLATAGHAIVTPRPALCPLETDTKPLRGLSGLRARVSMRAFRESDAQEPFASSFGEVLFRDYGISGIVTFDMSRLVGEGDWIGIDFFPDMPAGQLEGWLSNRLASLQASAPSFSELMCGMLHTRVNDAVLRMAGCKPSDEARADALGGIASTAKDFRIRVIGYGDARQAQVTRGGAATKEFDAQTLESKLHAGLFAAGETLNVDGRCGGFNLHWAWASGIVSGKRAALSL